MLKTKPLEHLLRKLEDEILIMEHYNQDGKLVDFMREQLRLKTEETVKAQGCGK